MRIPIGPNWETPLSYNHIFWQMGLLSTMLFQLEDTSVWQGDSVSYLGDTCWPVRVPIHNWKTMYSDWEIYVRTPWVQIRIILFDGSSFKPHSFCCTSCTKLTECIELCNPLLTWVKKKKVLKRQYLNRLLTGHGIGVHWLKITGSFMQQKR